MDAGPIRVAVLSDAFIRYGTAQAGGLQDAGAEVTFYYVDRLGEFDGNHADRQRYLEAVHRRNIPAVALPQRSLRRMHRHIAALHRDLREREIDVLVVHQHIDPRYATLGLRLPVAMYLHDPRPHSGDHQSSYPRYVRAMARIAEATASCIVLHSERLVDQLPAMLRRVPRAVVPHGAEVAASPTPLVLPPTVTLVGRLMAYKGVDVALKAFGSISAQRPEIRMLVAGQGRMGPEIRAASPPGVDLVDRYVSEDELSAFLDDARLVVLPYRDATQSGVGLQAVARGIPCIVSDAGALPDLVPPGREWVAARGDADALAAALGRALDHDASVREQLLAYAREHFAWPSVGRRLLDELTRLEVTGQERDA